MSTNCWLGKTRIIDLYESWPSVRPSLVLSLFTVLLMINYDGQVVQSFPLDGRSAVVVFSEDIGTYLICQDNSSTPVVLNASLHDLQQNASRWTNKTVNFCDDLDQANSQDGFRPHLVYFRKQIMGGTAIAIGESSTVVSFTPVNETHSPHRPFGPWETAEQKMLSLKPSQECPMSSPVRTETGRTGRMIYKFKSGKRDFAVVTELVQKGETVSGINSIFGGSGLFLLTNRCEGQELFALTCSCHGHTPLLMNATAANAEFDNGELLLYVAFVSSIPDQRSTKNRFVCSFDIFHVLNTTAGRFGAERRSDMTPRHKLCTAVFSEGHVAEVLATRIDDQIIILYRNQHTIHLLSQNFVKQPSFPFFMRKNSEILAMAISNKDVSVDILTEKELVRLPLNSCSSYSTCDQCIVSRMDNCGWCILENKCTIRQTCFRLNITLTDQHNFWLNAHRGVRASSCPTIRHMHSSFYAAVEKSTTTDHLVKLTLARYPDFGKSNLVVMCVFPRRENHTEGNQTMSVWHVTTNDHPVIECPIPGRLRSKIWLSPGHPFYDHQTVLIQVTDGQQSATIATASMIVYKSCDQLSCSECLSLYPTCGWTFRNGTGMCRSSDNNTTQIVTCEAPDATGRTPATDSIDSINPIMLENNPIHGPLAEETVIRFTGQNLPETLTVSVGKDECVIISRDSSSLNCSIRPDVSVYEIGNVTLYIADTTKGELRCKNCSFAFTGKRWKALSTVVPGFPLGTDQELAKVDRTDSGTILVGATGGAALAIFCFFVWIIWQTYRKTKKIKIDIEHRMKRVSQRLSQHDMGSLCENVRSMVIRLIPPQPLQVVGADASSALLEEHTSVQ
ncbi:hypothetical protein BV898_00755 [Hypsibius exemplaris]|uniref:PSI domain-containing protein n=1 Tax=Hypsibius exemplaris TaxID=2072580 RepID=A0A1W0XED1_HYPEX|nr:hypothetical protein BV898_00755 [Hypsibius exemplaris]